MKADRRAVVIALLVVLVMNCIFWFGSFALSSYVDSGVVKSSGIADQVQSVRSSVVHIEKVGECEGSGCIISEDGIIFTAKHVTDSVPGDYKVTTDANETYKVGYVIEDREHDVAFLKLKLPEGKKLHPAELADTSKMRVGDPLFIMGSPYGRENFNSVSLGILSASTRNLDKSHNEGYGWRVTFQSDATAAPGSSGGPVFNIRGQVIGVLVARVSNTVNYSVPVATFKGDLGTIRDWFGLSKFKVVERKPFAISDAEWAEVNARVGLLEQSLDLLSKKLESQMKEVRDLLSEPNEPVK
jgi:S1-C subfamily serine protease